MQALLGPQFPTLGTDETRLPGETRQEWRRRMRSANAPQPQSAQAVDKFGLTMRAAKESEHANDPWRQRGARGTWDGAR